MQISHESTCVGVFFNKVAGLQHSNFIKKRLQHRFFPVKIAKFLRTLYFTDYLQQLPLTVSGFQPATFDRTPPDDCFLCLSVNFERFFKTAFLQSTYGKLLISCTSCRISTSRYSKKLFQKCFSSILYKDKK